VQDVLAGHSPYEGVCACLCLTVCACLCLTVCARALARPQGPEAAAVVAALAPGTDLKTMYFSDFRTFDVAGIPCWVTRTGCAARRVPNTHGLACGDVLGEPSRRAASRVNGTAQRPASNFEALLHRSAAQPARTQRDDRLPSSCALRRV
jgi:hypothetical protein